MKAIILAAGRGCRMGNLTAHIPKCMIEFLNKPILEYTFETLNRNKSIDKIVVIRGYHAEKINYPNIKYYDVINSQNMVETLFFAKEELDDDTLILYSDVIMSEEIIDLLMKAENDISVCIDGEWKQLHLLRFNNFDDDLESCSLKNNNIIDIGAKNPDISEVMGQFFGAIRLTKKGCEVFKAFYENERQKADFHRTWMRERSFDSIYLTDFLQGLISEGNAVTAVMCNKGWLEFDSAKDLELYKKLHKNHRLNEFITI